MMHKGLISAILILIAYILTCIAVWTGPYFQSAVSISVGEVALARVVATRDVENPLATDHNRAEAQTRAYSMPPVTTLDTSIDEHVFDALNTFFDRIDYIRTSYYFWLITHEEAYQAAYEQWQQDQSDWERAHRRWQQQMNASADEDETEEPPEPEAPATEFIFETEDFSYEEQFAPTFVLFSPSQQQFLLNLPEREYEDFYEILQETIRSTLEDPGIAEVNALALTEVRRILTDLTANEESTNIGLLVIESVLRPNRVFNEAADQIARQEIAEDYERVYLLQYEIIVDENQIITEEAFAIMESLGMLEADWQRDVVPLIGIFILVAVTIFACCYFIYFYRAKIVKRPKDALLLLTLYILILAVIWVIDGAPFYFAPILVFTMLVAMLISTRIAMLLNLGLTIIAYFVIDGTIQYMIFFMISGSLICLFAKYTTERSKIMMVGLLAALSNFILAIAILLAFEPHQAIYSVPALMTTGAIAALSGILAVIIAVGSLPLWEVTFGVVTPLKLLDLTNPTNPLMRRLTLEAPGTYHHSLIVANLAESAAYDIGANPHIARAGGYYHDIGKLKYPQYFAENITGPSPHDEMDPYDSAQIIISHISHGLDLAAEYRLPPFIREIIEEHHGTSLVRYFYCKAKDEAEASEEKKLNVDKNDFKYPYTTPKSRESAIVMLADRIEATVRAMMTKGNDIGSMQELINKMIKENLTNDTLADSQLSISDVDTIAKSFYRVLKGMYHERIPYPQESQEVESHEVDEESSIVRKV